MGFHFFGVYLFFPVFLLARIDMIGFLRYDLRGALSELALEQVEFEPIYRHGRESGIGVSHGVPDPFLARYRSNNYSLRKAMAWLGEQIRERGFWLMGGIFVGCCGVVISPFP